MAINRVGDWDAAASQAQGLDDKRSRTNMNWDRTSVRTFASPKATEKFVKRYERVPHDFVVYLVQNPGQGTGNATTYGQKEANRFYKDYNIDPQQAPIIPGKINVFFTQWDQDQPTPWMLAHRMGHALYGVSHEMWGLINTFVPKIRQLNKIDKAIIPDEFAPPGSPKKERFFKWLKPDDLDRSQPFTKLMYELGTMKSFRTGAVQNDGEAIHELFAQYIMQGRVKLNNPDPSSEIGQSVAEFEAAVNADMKDTLERAKEWIIVW